MSHRVSDIGEFGLIDHLHRRLPDAVRADAELVAGIGDDAAVWQPPPGEQIVVTTDAMVEGVHFDLDWTSFTDLGHKALAVNLSDIAAMGSEPQVAVVTLGIAGDPAIDDLDALYDGMGALAARCGVQIAGGDMVRSPGGLLIAITLLGTTRGGRFLRRSGARPGDTIAVSGTLGAAAAGLALERLPGDDPRRANAVGGRLLAALHRPEPRLDLGRVLLDGRATAAMDISDGLIGDLTKLARASGVRAEVDVERVPVAPAAAELFGDAARRLALSGGDDYELLFTASADAMATISAAASARGTPVTAIGKILSEAEGEPIVRLVPELDAAELRSFDHFG